LAAAAAATRGERHAREELLATLIGEESKDEVEGDVTVGEATGEVAVVLIGVIVDNNDVDG